MKIKLSTINVLELVNDTPLCIASYPDNKRGNAAAERLFCRRYREHNDPDGTTGVPPATKEILADLMDDGIYDDGAGYKLVLIHST